VSRYYIGKTWTTRTSHDGKTECTTIVPEKFALWCDSCADLVAMGWMGTTPFFERIEIPANNDRETEGER